MKTELSLEEKLNEATRISLLCAYSEITPKGSFFTARYEAVGEIGDLIWGYADGLEQKYIYDRMTGRCSIHASINFDIEKAESCLDADIMRMKAFLSEYGEPVKLTSEEMTKRGYVGY